MVNAEKKIVDLLSKCVVVEGCWEWTRTVDRDGYGRVWFMGRQDRAHRVMYRLMRGEIPSDRQIDHLCNNRGCINPGHLRVVTVRENSYRSNGRASINLAKVSCISGHPLSGDNLYVNPNTGDRTCRTCSRSYKRAYKARKRAAKRMAKEAAA